MLYHYTSFDALKNILRYAKSQEQMCFWATRYDCFADTDEFKLGVETIRRLLPEMEKELQPDRQIAPLFDWNEIKDNKNLDYTTRFILQIIRISLIPILCHSLHEQTMTTCGKSMQKRMGWLWQLTIHNMCRFLMLP